MKLEKCDKISFVVFGVQSVLFVSSKPKTFSNQKAQWRSKFPRGVKYEKKKLKVTCPVALVMAFLTAENEIRLLEDLPQADFDRVPEKISSVGKEKAKINN